MLAFIFGPFGGFDDDGNVAGMLDIEWHYETAKANGAGDHILRAPKTLAGPYRAV